MTLIAKKTAASEGVRVLMLSSVHQLAQSRRDDNQHNPSPEWGDMNRYRSGSCRPFGTIHSRRRSCSMGLHPWLQHVATSCWRNFVWLLPWRVCNTVL